MFCDVDCRAAARRQHIEAVLAGEADAVSGSMQCRIVRRHLMERHDRRCQICGITEWRGHPAPLVCDHINGDPTDNAPANLRLICGNCDMQLPTYKSRNRGNGRHARRVRYAEGKSY